MSQRVQNVTQGSGASAGNWVRARAIIRAMEQALVLVVVVVTVVCAVIAVVTLADLEIERRLREL